MTGDLWILFSCGRLCQDDLSPETASLDGLFQNFVINALVYSQARPFFLVRNFHFPNPFDLCQGPFHRNGAEDSRHTLYLERDVLISCMYRMGYYQGKSKRYR